jgi:osmotically-inducible protein OsmY
MLQKLATLLSAAGLVMTVACSQTDTGITTSVKSKLAADTTVKAHQIDVDTSKGVVTLTGVVDTQAAKAQAVSIARNTNGVTDVVDHMTVSETTAAAPLDRDHVVDQPGEGISGATRTAGEKIGEKAEEATDKTKAGIEKTGEVIEDSAITTAVKTKLLADTKAPGLKIDVDTKNGVVTLSGNVKSKAEAAKAVADARGTKGVKRVINNLKIAA